MLAWAQSNILKWTVGIAVCSFLFGPFLQDTFTIFLQRSVYGEKAVNIFVCTPLRNATLLVSSSKGQNRKIHSAGRFPFMQQARVIVVNSSGHPVPNSSVFVAPLNISSNYLTQANFYSDGNLSAGLDSSFKCNG